MYIYSTITEFQQTISDFKILLRPSEELFNCTAEV